MRVNVFFYSLGRTFDQIGEMWATAQMHHCCIIWITFIIRVKTVTTKKDLNREQVQHIILRMQKWKKSRNMFNLINHLNSGLYVHSIYQSMQYNTDLKKK